MKYSNKKLIYDDHCPLCRWYSAQFVRFGLLLPENRIPFSSASEEILAAIDFKRATDEIPFVDTSTQQTTYGLDALLEILSVRIPLIGKLGHIQPIHYFFRKLYKLISLNRKVIVATICSNAGVDCSPSFSLKYRWFFIVLGTIFVFVSSLMFYKGIEQVYDFVFDYNQFLIGSILFCFASYSPALFLPRKKSLEFLGQHTVLGIILTILLITLGTIQSLFPLSDWHVYLFHFLVGYILIKEYERRMTYLLFHNLPRLVPYLNYLCLAGFLALTLIHSNKLT